MVLKAILICIMSSSGSLEEARKAQIEVESHNQIYNLYDMGIPIEGFKEGWIETRLTDKEARKLEALGYNVIFIPDYAKLFADSLWEATKNTDNPLGAYHTYEELTQELEAIADSNPEICRLESIGQSVLEKELWFMKISDNVDIEEDEPEFKYISTMHGNEPVGMELLLYLIQYLVDNYGKDDDISWLVNETEIWIMPLMNPDGYIAHSRYNANWVDLNRNFPDRITDSLNTPEGREPETQAVMNWAFNHSSILSANFHTGALVVNYPYDSAENPSPHYEPAPDDELFIYISEAYSIHNEPMWNGGFYHGITNGADWYVIYGGMQDWNYVWLGCNEVTIELCNDFWPPAALLDTLWGDNREALLAYMEQCHIGVRGIVTGAITGEPLGATINVLEIGQPVFTDPGVGDYHRMLLAGDYTLEFSSPGFITTTIPCVHVGTDSVTWLDVALWPDDIGTISGTVTDQKTGSPIYAKVKVMNAKAESTNTDSTMGHYSINIYEGIYSMEVSADSYETCVRESVEVIDSITQDFQLIPINPVEEEVARTITPTLQCFPNPFSLKTDIRYQIPETGEISLRIYDVTGRLVKTLVECKKEPGSFAINWNACDEKGKRVSPGVYFLKFGGLTRKLVYLK